MKIPGVGGFKVCQRRDRYETKAAFPLFPSFFLLPNATSPRPSAADKFRDYGLKLKIKRLHCKTSVVISVILHSIFQFIFPYHIVVFPCWARCTVPHIEEGACCTLLSYSACSYYRMLPMGSSLSNSHRL